MFKNLSLLSNRPSNQDQQVETDNGTENESDYMEIDYRKITKSSILGEIDAKNSQLKVCYTY